MKTISRLPISEKLRTAFFDAYEGVCQHCFNHVADHVDHIRPISRGGQHVFANLIPACSDCNLGKSDKLLHPDEEKRLQSIAGSTGMKRVVDLYDNPNLLHLKARRSLNQKVSHIYGRSVVPVSWGWALKDTKRIRDLGVKSMVLEAFRRSDFYSYVLCTGSGLPMHSDAPVALELSESEMGVVFPNDEVPKDLGLYISFSDGSIELHGEAPLFKGAGDWNYRKSDGVVDIPLSGLGVEAAIQIASSPNTGLTSFRMGKAPERFSFY